MPYAEVVRRLAEMLLACAGFAIQYSVLGELVLGEFEGLADNLRKPVGEAVEAFAGEDLLAGAKYHNICNWSCSAISKRSSQNSDLLN